MIFSTVSWDMADNNGLIFTNEDTIINHETKDAPSVTKRIDKNIRISPHTVPPKDEPIVTIEDQKKLDDLVRKSSRVLFKAESVFPFDLFPDTIVIDETKVSIIYKSFFLTEIVHTILIKKIMDVRVESSLLFATLIFIPFVNFESPIEVRYLKKAAAHSARRLIQGIITCNENQIDMTTLSVEEIISKMNMLGAATANRNRLI